MKAWRAFKIASIVYCILIVETVVIYLYVDNYVQIPSSWIDSLNSVCPNYRKTHTFHYVAIAQEGYLILLPTFYFFHWLKVSEYGERLFPDNSKIDNEIQVPIIELALKILITLSIDYVFCDLLPLYFYGTKDIDVVPDFMKKASEMLAVAFFVQGPLTSYIALCFRCKMPLEYKRKRMEQMEQREAVQIEIASILGK